MYDFEHSKLESYGLKPTQRGAHFSRTIMLNELEQLLNYSDNRHLSKENYREIIECNNCLSKLSISNRKITYSKLLILYGLDDNLAVFKALKYLWSKDESSLPLLAMLLSINRDLLLYRSSNYIKELKFGEQFIKEDLKSELMKYPDFIVTPKSLESIIRNLSSSWSQTGFLIGKTKKFKTNPTATPTAVSLALFIGYIKGYRGVNLFETPYTKILNQNTEELFRLATLASSRGWITMNKLSNVIEVKFPNF